MATIDELVILLGAKIDPKHKSVLANFHGQMLVVANQAVALGEKIYGAFSRFNASLLQTGQNSLSLEQLSKRTQTATDDLQGLANAAEALGGSAAEAYGDMDKLNVPAARSGKSLLEYYEYLNGVFTKLSPQAQQVQGALLGISQSGIRLLSDPNYKKTVAAGKANANSPADIAAGAEGMRQWKILQVQLEAIATTIKAHLLPVVIRIIEPFKEWLHVNEDIIAQRLEQIFKGIAKGLETTWEWAGKVWTVIKAILSPFIDLSSATDDWSEAIAKIVPLVIGFVVALKTLSVLTAATGLLAGINPLTAAVLALAAAFGAAAYAADTLDKKTAAMNTDTESLVGSLGILADVKSGKMSREAGIAALEKRKKASMAGLNTGQAAGLSWWEQAFLGNEGTNRADANAATQKWAEVRRTDADLAALKGMPANVTNNVTIHHVSDESTVNKVMETLNRNTPGPFAPVANH